ncbi:MAG: double-strand break repair protein AddB [Pseudomonadota bacterium]
MTAAQVFAIPTGEDFGPGFARGFAERYGHLPPQERAQVTVLVNSTRARSVLVNALAVGQAGLLPKIALIQDLANRPELVPDLPPPLPGLRRRLRLTQLVEQFLQAKAASGERMAPVGAAADLAHTLALLIDQFHDQGLGLEGLDRALAGSELSDQAASHWQQTLAFIDIVRQAWPAIRAEDEGGRLDPRQRERATIEALIGQWDRHPPENPVIAAASTGSVASRAMLMAAIARLPQGAVVLPGFDPETDPDIWPEAEADHPLGPFRNFLDALKITPAEVQPWSDFSHHPRRALLAQALRPAPVTDHWHRAAPALRQELDQALQDVAVIEAPTPRQEAASIAVAVREVLEHPGKTVTVITPDAALGRRIGAELDRFGIIPDDIMGQPLAQSPAGIAARLALRVARDQPDPVAIAGLIGQPLVRLGGDRTQHLKLARRYERHVLRRGPIASPTSMLPDWPAAGAVTPDLEDLVWLDQARTALSPLAHAPVNLRDLVDAHIATLEALTADADGPAIWTRDDGAALQRFMTDLAANADALGGGQVLAYPALLDGLMRDLSLPTQERAPHPRVAIRGAREARLEDADLTILAGLNDGTWPAAPDPGPWLSRPMHKALGLPLPERAVGLSAHDFICAAARRQVMMTRSTRDNGAPTVSSRWLIRLETLLGGIGGDAAWQDAKARGSRYVALGDRLSKPAAQVPRAPRPAPVVPVKARPDRLSVTRIETLVRDAYAVYAQDVLGLKTLDPLGRKADARERGTVLHLVMELFTQRTRPWPGIDIARKVLIKTADDVLAWEVPWPDLRRTWRARIDRFAEWVLAEEDLRRQTGAPIGIEASGSMILPLPTKPLEIPAKADRIDRIGTDGAAVLDYKSGAPPSLAQIEQGFNHQLHVQAAILAAGGFAKLPALRAQTGAYIGLTGSGGGGRQTEIELPVQDVNRHLQNIAKLVLALDNGAPWLSRGRPYMIRFDGDYDHLARVGEWDAEEEA